MRACVVWVLLLISSTAAASVRGLVEQARGLMAQRQYRAAWERLHSATELAPTDWAASAELATVLLRMRSPECEEEAARYCGRRGALDAAEQAITNATTKQQRAMAEYTLGLLQMSWDLIAADAAFKRSLALRPSPQVARKEAEVARIVARLPRQRRDVFMKWAADWAAQRGFAIVDWWSARLEPDIGEVTHVAIICTEGGFDDYYLVESSDRRRYKIAVEAMNFDWPCIRPSDEPTTPFFRTTLWRTIHWRGGGIRFVENVDMALRGGRVVVSRYADWSSPRDSHGYGVVRDWRRRCANEGARCYPSPQRAAHLEVSRIE